MRAFYLVYGRVPQPVGLSNELPIVKIPWGHNIVIITKIKEHSERLWYAEQTIAHGLSRTALEDWIKSKAYKRHGKAITNFAQNYQILNLSLRKKHLKIRITLIFLPWILTIAN